MYDVNVGEASNEIVRDDNLKIKRNFENLYVLKFIVFRNLKKTILDSLCASAWSKDSSYKNKNIYGSNSKNFQELINSFFYIKNFKLYEISKRMLADFHKSVFFKFVLISTSTNI